jgi:hypothetical protein|nr:MAG TPA_asm: hypothetical protein [Caudoviricetes sp.]
MATEPEFEVYKKNAMRAAAELQYGHKVVAKIANAKNEAEVCRILHTARNKKIELEETYGGKI